MFLVRYYLNWASVLMCLEMEITDAVSHPNITVLLIAVTCLISIM